MYDSGAFMLMHRRTSMSLGTSIFLSAVLLSVVILFAVTKDRWNWKRILKWATATPLCLFAVVIGGMYLQDAWESRPTPQTQFDGFSLGASPGDIKLAKGEPNEIVDSERWLYYSGDRKSGYQVNFQDNKVRYVLYASTEANYSTPNLLNLTKGATRDEIKARLGEPSHVHTSSDSLRQVLSYDKYNVFFELEKHRVIAYGIYHRTFGPMQFDEEKKSQ
jgi:hypothetical protein